MIERVISGGQTGADESGLFAAKEFGIETGGWMPPKFLNEWGHKPEYAELYGMKEHAVRGYQARTRANVRDSDGTIRFAVDFRSAGEKCTMKAIREFGKPYLDVQMGAIIGGESSEEQIKIAVKWIQTKNIRVLNVAGNRESTRPGLCKKAQDFLKEVFVLVNGQSLRKQSELK